MLSTMSPGTTYQQSRRTWLTRLEGHLGKFSRNTDHDRENTIAYISSLPEETNEHAVEYALDQVVPCVVQQAKQEFWDAKSTTNKMLVRLGVNQRPRDAPSYEKSWDRYADILEGRMDYVDGELITKPSNESAHDNEKGNDNVDEDGRDIDDKYDNTEQDVKEIIAYVLELDASKIKSDDDFLRDLGAKPGQLRRIYELLCKSTTWSILSGPPVSKNPEYDGYSRVS
ncbi:hypothetical protein CNMCM5793_008206 [Aspergillus hiratsukae]|uniref:Uncharacterized protein n=1 Tax=Aspergillus hiratsukae TaxID=1194566 RepID=A0A8H6P7B6_9EURO|nr:hypothetical protein CNMCM5793_008206 [Aspergillus hiratsukae]KAF7163695.1 hypothetical protein CNMCM6106_000511 [Aspergillus hiratsukae]